jgi:hypothetical protein
MEALIEASLQKSGSVFIIFNQYNNRTMSPASYHAGLAVCFAATE